MRYASVARRASIPLMLALLAQGCGVSGLSFRADERVSIVSPRTNEEVTLPFELDWKAEDVDGYYAVFFDRSPMRPNQTIESLVPDNDPCRATDTCGTAEWLAERDVYITGETSLTVDFLPDRRTTNRAKDRHEVTIVLLDRKGRRVNESAFIREFIIKRGDL